MKLLNVGFSKLVCSLDTVQEYADNILNTAYSLDSEDAKQFIEESKQWYNIANELCKSIGVATGLDSKIVAGVIAALSPNQSWVIQERHTLKFIQDIQSGIDYKETGYGYFANRLKASQIILNKKVFPYLSGQKVTAFYNNIIGNYNTVTIDIWAVRVALNDYSLTRNECGLCMRDYYKRDEIVKAYKVAAKRLNMPVATCQALVWCIGRNIISKQLELSETIS